MLIERYSLVRFIKYQHRGKFFIFIFPIYLIFFVRILIELNRTPFDLVEGESELVSGFNTEYFRRRFALIFIAEYANIIFTRFLITFIFIYRNIYSFIFIILFIFHVIFII